MNSRSPYNIASYFLENGCQVAEVKDRMLDDDKNSSNSYLTCQGSYNFHLNYLYVIQRVEKENTNNLSNIIIDGVTVKSGVVNGIENTIIFGLNVPSKKKFYQIRKLIVRFKKKENNCENLIIKKIKKRNDYRNIIYEKKNYSYCESSEYIEIDLTNDFVNGDIKNKEYAIIVNDQDKYCKLYSFNCLCDSDLPLFHIEYFNCAFISLERKILKRKSFGVSKYEVNIRNGKPIFYVGLTKHIQLVYNCGGKKIDNLFPYGWKLTVQQYIYKKEKDYFYLDKIGECYKFCYNEQENKYYNLNLNCYLEIKDDFYTIKKDNEELIFDKLGRLQSYKSKEFSYHNVYSENEKFKLLSFYTEDRNVAIIYQENEIIVNVPNYEKITLHLEDGNFKRVEKGERFIDFIYDNSYLIEINNWLNSCLKLYYELGRIKAIEEKRNEQLINRFEIEYRYLSSVVSFNEKKKKYYFDINGNYIKRK